MNDRRLTTEEFPWRRIALVWMFVSLLMLANAAKNIAIAQFPDPDDVLRLVQVRDLLGGQGWFDLNQYRIDPAGDVPMHWSRLVDLPLALMIGALTPLLGTANAELLSVVMVPLLTMLATMLIIARMTWRLFDTETAGLACLAFGFLPFLIFQFQPMRIDHHGWQIFAVALAMFAINMRSQWAGGALAGLAMAAGLLVSLELLPVAAVFGAVLALRWLRDPAQRVWLVGYLQSLALSLGALYLATRGLSDLAAYCDAITLPHIGLFAAVALGASALALPKALPWPAIVGGLACAGLAGITIFGVASPSCLRTPFGELDPLVREFWYLNVREGRPLWAQPIMAIPQLFQIGLAFVVAVHLFRSADGKVRGWWRDYLIVLAGTVLLGLLVWRSMAFASVLAAIPLGFALKLALDKLRNARETAAKALAVGGLMLVLVPSAPVVAASYVTAPDIDEEELIKGPLQASSCDLTASSASLNALEPGVIFAPLDIGPALLQRSPHTVVATGHHRAEKAMRDIIVGYTSSPDTTRALMRKHAARYVVVCTDIMEPNLYAEEGGRNSFAARLLRNDAPEWMERVALDTPKSFRVWRIADRNE